MILICASNYDFNFEISSKFILLTLLLKKRTNYALLSYWPVKCLWLLYPAFLNA